MVPRFSVGALPLPPGDRAGAAPAGGRHDRRLLRRDRTSAARPRAPARSSTSSTSIRCGAPLTTRCAPAWCEASSARTLRALRPPSRSRTCSPNAARPAVAKITCGIELPELSAIPPTVTRSPIVGFALRPERTRASWICSMPSPAIREAFPQAEFEAFGSLPRRRTPARASQPRLSRRSRAAGLLPAGQRVRVPQPR